MTREQRLHIDETSEDAESIDPTVNAVASQLFSGWQVGTSKLTAYCATCKDALGEGDAIRVYAYHPQDDDRWYLRRCYCSDCAPTQIHTPTRGVTELLIEAWLGTVALPKTRTHRLCLVEVGVQAYSSSSTGYCA